MWEPSPTLCILPGSPIWPGGPGGPGGPTEPIVEGPGGPRAPGVPGIPGSPIQEEEEVTVGLVYCQVALITSCPVRHITLIIAEYLWVLQCRQIQIVLVDQRHRGNRDLPLVH